MIRSLLCLVLGHDIVGGVIGWPMEGHPGQEPHYACRRCLAALTANGRRYRG